MCKQADVATKYTNHSLRATATSKMFFLNVSEKINADGHRSLAGLRAYEHTTHAQGAGNYKKSELFQCCLY